MAEPSLPGDIVLTDQFHRLKRTTLIFCAVIIATRVPGVDFGAATQSIWAPFKNVSPSWTLLLLWVGASYYAVGFVGEYLAAHRSNAELLIDRSGRHLAQTLKEADRVATDALVMLNAAREGLPGVTAAAILAGLREQIATQLRERFPPHRTNQFPIVDPNRFDVHKQISDLVSEQSAVVLVNTWNLLWSEATESIRKQINEEYEEFLAEIRQNYLGNAQQLENLLAAIQSQQAGLTKLRSALPGLRRPLATLNFFGAARTLMFWVWEGAAVVVMYVLATAIFIYYSGLLAKAENLFQMWLGR